MPHYAMWIGAYPVRFLPTRGTASDVAGTIPATIIWNKLNESRMVIPNKTHEQKL